MIAFARTATTRVPYRETASAIVSVAAAMALDQPDVLIASWTGHHFDLKSVRYALDHPGISARPIPWSCVTWERALAERRPFVTILVVYMGPVLPPESRPELERAAPGYDFRQVYHDSFYQEPYTAMPTPYMRHSIEVWLCTPGAR